MKYVLNAEQIRHDVIDAVLESSELEPYSALHKAQVLEQKLGAPGFKETAEALGRVISISKKGAAETFSLICLKMNTKQNCLMPTKQRSKICRKTSAKKIMRRRLLHLQP